jgi:hypothetical protein
MFYNFYKRGECMKNRILLSVLAVLASTVTAARAESDKERQEDVVRHRAIAAAHEAAAKCIEAKKPKELKAACKGLAIGKFCGMRHQH